MDDSSRPRAPRAAAQGALAADTRWRAVVPVLDEAAALPGLLVELAEFPGLDQVIFVDNGSTDESPALLADAGAHVVRETHRGYDSACLAGTRAARAAGAEVVVFMEADGTDHPQDLARLLGPVLTGDVDLMVGSRRAAVRRRVALMPAHQRLGNDLTVLTFRLLYGLRLPDNGPYRAVRLPLLDSLDMSARGFAWTTEMVLKTHLAGARIAWTEVSYRERRGSSKIAGTWLGTAKAFRDIIGTALALRFRRVAQPYRPGARRP